MNALRLAVLALSWGLMPMGVAAADHEFYISPTGDDANPGTRQKPWLTLAHARDQVRIQHAQLDGDITVWLRGGIYPLSEPCRFTPADSGQAGHPVTYRAYGHEEPILSGGVRVTGWSLDHGAVYRATLASDRKLRCLYVNGQRAALTQRVFQGAGPWGEFVVQGNEPWAETPGRTLDGVAFDDAQLPSLTNPDDLELLQRRTWNFLVLGVRGQTNIDGRSILQLQQPYGAIAATMAWDCNLAPTNKFTVRNAYEFLDGPGQFYFNRRTHILYYWPRSGEDLANAEVIAPVSEGLIQITGNSTNDRVSHLVFQGLTLAYDHWQLIQVGESHGMVGVQSLGLYTKFRADGDHHQSHYNVCDLPQATVALQNASDIRWERNQFRHLASGSAVSLENDVVDCAVVGNVFQDLSGNAVNIGHPQHYAIGDGPKYPAGVEGLCQRDRVANNYIRQVSLDYKQGEAISGFFSAQVTIEHNDIDGVPYGGIALGWWWGNAGIPAPNFCRGNVIRANKVFHTQQELPKDGGAIYVLGEQPGGIIEGNYVHSLSRLMYADDGSAGWTIARNVFDPEPKGKWLFLWTPRIHDLTITDNFTTTTNLQNKTTNCVPLGTMVYGLDVPRAANKIMAAAGLEKAYRDIIPPAGRLK